MNNSDDTGVRPRFQAFYRYKVKKSHGTQNRVVILSMPALFCALNLWSCENE